MYVVMATTMLIKQTNDESADKGGHMHFTYIVDLNSNEVYIYCE